MNSTQKRLRSLAVTVIIVAVINFALSLMLGCADTGAGNDTRAFGNQRGDTTSLQRVPAPRYPFTGFWFAGEQTLTISEIGDIAILETATETIPVLVVPVEGKSAFALVINTDYILRLSYNEPQITITQYKGKFAFSTIGIWKRS